MKQLQLQSPINYMEKFYCLRAFKISYQNAQITEELEKKKKEKKKGPSSTVRMSRINYLRNNKILEKLKVALLKEGCCLAPHLYLSIMFR